MNEAHKILGRIIHKDISMQLSSRWSVRLFEHSDAPSAIVCKVIGNASDQLPRHHWLTADFIEIVFRDDTTVIGCTQNSEYTNHSYASPTYKKDIIDIVLALAQKLKKHRRKNKLRNKQR